MRARGESRKPLARALSNLLELRFAVVRIPQALQVLVNRFGIPATEADAYAPLLQQLIPGIEDSVALYQAAVEEISAVDPLFAFELRHRAVVAQIDDLTAPVRAAVPDGERQWAVLRSTLLQEMKRPLEEAILSLAWRYSLWTWLKLKVRMRKLVELPSELEQLIENIERMMHAEHEDHSERYPSESVAGEMRPGMATPLG